MNSRTDQGVPPSAPNPPPYSEKDPYNQLPLPANGSANPAMPTQYQPHAPYSVVPGQGAIILPPQHSTFIVSVQPTHEPDYLGYSIFTMLFCFLPLGIAALVFSIKTRDANHAGNSMEAQRNSRMARIFASSSLGVGAVLVIVIVIIVVAT